MAGNEGAPVRLALVVLALIVTATGAALAIVYPRMMERSLGREIGRWEVFSPEQGFSSVETTLSPSGGGTVVFVEIVSSAPLRAGTERELLSMTIRDGASTEILSHVMHPPIGGTLESPQTGVMRYRERIATIERGPGPHAFDFAQGPQFDPSIMAIDLALNAAATPVDPNARPVGLGLMAFGLLVFVLSMIGRGSRRQNPNSSPPPPKWGRR